MILESLYYFSIPRFKMSISDEYDEEVPILIIGGGPSGLLLAYMLDQLGSRYFLVWQTKNLYNNPIFELQFDPSLQKDMQQDSQPQKPTHYLHGLSNYVVSSD